MHTYKKTGDVWTVGYYILVANKVGGGSRSEWVALVDCVKELQAARRVNYLNGGSGYLFDFTLDERV